MKTNIGCYSKKWGSPYTNQVSAAVVVTVGFLARRQVARAATDDEIAGRRFSFRCGLIAIVPRGDGRSSVVLDGFPTLVGWRNETDTTVVIDPDVGDEPVAVVDFVGAGTRHGELQNETVVALALVFRDCAQLAQYTSDDFLARKPA